MTTFSETPHPSLGVRNPIRLSDVPSSDLVEASSYLRQAIAAGSILPNPSHETVTRVSRRALIVAPIYMDNPNRLELCSTAIDAKLKHEMLVRCGYERQNIRVLCDICGGFYGLAYPTRENILGSLEWLTSGTQPGDHRFFYFSGYGGRVLQEKDVCQVKKARCVLIGGELGHGFRVHTLDRESNKATEQKVPEMSLSYYNEAIITRYDELGQNEPQDRCSKILDSELIQYWSNLPSGSILTCIMDCCVDDETTGIGNTPKRLGVGVQSGKPVPMVKERFGVLKNVPDSSIDDEGPELPPTPDSGLAVAALRNTSDMMSTTISLANSQGTKVPENMPEREQQMNDIQATTFIWTGCHQHQFRDLCGSGILVQAFISIPQTNFATPTSGLITCGDLFRRISDILATRPSGITSPQLYQLWTSAEDQLANLMELPVTL